MSNILGNMPPVFGSGYRGVVPAPSEADVSAQNILRADGVWAAGPSGTLPSQTGNAGKLLTTDGTNASWSSTLSGNLTVSGTGGVQLNSVANLTWGGSYGAGIPTIAIPSATSIGFYPTGSTSGKTFELFGTGNATLTGNLTVSGTGLNVGGNAQTYAEVVVNAANGAGQGGYLSVKSAGVVKSAVGSKAGITGSGTSNNLLLKSFSDAIELDAATTTVSGNLTVSGTATIKNGLAASATGTAFSIQTTDANPLVLFAELEGNATSSLRYASLNAYMNGGGGGRNLVLNRYGGDVLIGATVNGGNGKLQLADHTTSAGGIGFGTDTSLYRAGGGQLVLSHASLPVFSLYEGSTNTGEFYSSSGNVVLGSKVASRSLTFRTVNTIALTLDSSQNATFAGNVTVSGTGTSTVGGALYVNGALYRSAAAGTNRGLTMATSGSDRWFVYTDSAAESGSNAGSNFNIVRYSDAGSFIDTPFSISRATGNATFAGTVIANKATTAFRIPTAETPASAAATGTVGTITWDASYIYVCTAANTWKRVAIATWP